MSETQRKPSVSAPPEVKLEHVRVEGRALLIAAMTEVLGLVLSTYLLSTDKIDTTLWAGMFGYCLSGAVISRARGRVVSITGAGVLGLLSLGGGGKAAVIAKAILGRAFFG